MKNEDPAIDFAEKITDIYKDFEHQFNNDVRILRYNCPSDIYQNTLNLYWNSIEKLGKIEPILADRRWRYTNFKERIRLAEFYDILTDIEGVSKYSIKFEELQILDRYIKEVDRIIKDGEICLGEKDPKKVKLKIKLIIAKILNNIKLAEKKKNKNEVELDESVKNIITYVDSGKILTKAEIDVFLDEANKKWFFQTDKILDIQKLDITKDKSGKIIKQEMVNFIDRYGCLYMSIVNGISSTTGVFFTAEEIKSFYGNYINEDLILSDPDGFVRNIFNSIGLKSLPIKVDKYEREDIEENGTKKESFKLNGVITDININRGLKFDDVIKDIRKDLGEIDDIKKREDKNKKLKEDIEKLKKENSQLNTYLEYYKKIQIEIDILSYNSEKYKLTEKNREEIDKKVKLRENTNRKDIEKIYYNKVYNEDGVWFKYVKNKKDKELPLKDMIGELIDANDKLIGAIGGLYYKNESFIKNEEEKEFKKYRKIIFVIDRYSKYGNGTGTHFTLSDLNKLLDKNINPKDKRAYDPDSRIVDGKNSIHERDQVRIYNIIIKPK